MTRPTNGSLTKLLLGGVFALLTITFGLSQSAMSSRIDTAESRASAAEAKAAEAVGKVVEVDKTLVRIQSALDQNGVDHKAIQRQLDQLIQMHLKPGTR